MPPLTVKTMLKISALTLTLLPLSSFAADCAELVGCDRKFCEIEKQIEYAKANNNAHKLKGLNEALSEAKENCTNQSLYEEVQEDISETQADIAEYQADLTEAEAAGKADKVTKYNNKIKEEQKKLQQLQQQLSELEQTQ